MKILIVEDSKNMSGVLKEVLEHEGITVLQAFDGVAGLLSARREKPDLVLLDLLLPKMSGYDVCSRLMTDNLTRHIPVLVVSTLDTRDSMNKLRAAGARHFMKKPYSLDELLAKIHSLLPKPPSTGA
jgi:DNA-binding response OmpR family regulator